eukprot:COSAG01_NODE_16857_length_1198_cov_2.898999_1_plen_83_part_00
MLEQINLNAFDAHLLLVFEGAQSTDVAVIVKSFLRVGEAAIRNFQYLMQLRSNNVFLVEVDAIEVGGVLEVDAVGVVFASVL